MIIGYARLTRPTTQAMINSTRQRLITAGAERLYVDSNPLNREAALMVCGRDDVLLALNAAQLAWSVQDLLTLADRLSARGASLRILHVTDLLSLDTTTPQGATMLGALALLTAFDRSDAASFAVSVPLDTKLFSPPRPDDEHDAMDALMSNLLSARRPRGRPPTASTQAVEITRLRANGMRATEIAEQLNICRASVYRVLNLTPTDTPHHRLTPKSEGRSTRPESPAHRDNADAVSR